MSDREGYTPKVFTSSTNIDLEAYRKEAGMAAHTAGILADLQENWTAKESSKNNFPIMRRNVVRIQGGAKGA